MRFSSSVKHLHNMHLSAPSPQIHLGWTIDGRSKKGRFKHTLYFGTLHAYLRSVYACAWIILSNILCWTRLWSREVFHRWSTIPWIAHGGNFPRTSKWPFPRTSKWAMSKELWIGISGNFHWVLIFIWNNCGSPATILVRKYFSKLFSWNGQKFH